MAKMRRILASVLLAIGAFSGMAQEDANTNVSTDVPTFEVPKLEIAKELKTYNFNAPKPTFDYYPEALPSDIRPKHSYLFDVSAQKSIASWDNGMVSASASQFSLPGFMGMESGRFSITQQFGKFSLSGSVSAEKYGFYRRLDTTPEDALNGTTVINTTALLEGAAIVRVHDVKEAVEAVKLTQLITNPS